MIPLYLSRPGLWMPETKLTNEDVLERVRDRYQGPAAQWPLVENGVNLIFKACQSAERFKEQDPTVRIGTMAVRASRDCLAMCNQAPEELDAVIYGGIGRDYLEPATAMEVAGKLGVEQARILDVVGACTGQLLAITTACAWLLVPTALVYLCPSAAPRVRSLPAIETTLAISHTPAPAPCVWWIKISWPAAKPGRQVGTGTDRLISPNSLGNFPNRPPGPGGLMGALPEERPWTEPPTNFLLRWRSLRRPRPAPGTNCTACSPH